MTSDQMDPLRRELYLRILNDEADFHPITMRLHFLDDHFPPHQLDDALRWLVRSDLIGVRFASWFKHVCAGSDLEMHRLLLAVLANKKVGAVVAGKNFKV